MVGVGKPVVLGVATEEVGREGQAHLWVVMVLVVVVVVFEWL